MSTDTSDQERTRRQTLFLKSHLFGLIAAVRHPKGRGGDYHIASGLIIIEQGVPLLVTAAHFLKDVRKWWKQSRLDQLALLVHNPSGHCLAPIDLRKNPFWCSKKTDIGFMVLEPKLINAAARYAGIPVAAEKARAANDGLGLFGLVGHISGLVKLTTETIAVGEIDGREYAWQLSKINAVPVALVVLRYDGEGDYPSTYRFTPTDLVGDYRGASGAPVFGWKEGAGIEDYYLVGIQSTQILDKTRDQKPKHLIAVSAASALQEIRDYLAKTMCGGTFPEVKVWISTAGAKYHRDGCRYLSRSKIPMPLSRAKASYSPCSVCRPPG